MTTAKYGMPQGFTDTSDTRKHPHTPVRDNKSTGNILYIYNTRTRARNEETEPLESCKTAFYMAFGFYPAPRIIDQITAMTDDGISPDLIRAVLNYTADHAPRPTWAYAQAVIRRKLDEGITTGEAFEASVAAWYAAAAQRRQDVDSGTTQRAPKNTSRAGKTVIEQRYSQREYSPEKYLGLTPEELAEVRSYDQA